MESALNSEYGYGQTSERNLNFITAYDSGNRFNRVWLEYPLYRAQMDLQRLSQGKRQVLSKASRTLFVVALAP